MRKVLAYSLIFIPLLLAQHPWPMFQHDSKRTGRSPFVGPELPVEKWRFLLNNTEGVSSPAIATDGTVYVCSYDFNQGLYAVRQDGSRKWLFRGCSGASSPAVDGAGTIYGASGFYVYAVRPDSTEEWRCPVGFVSVSSVSLGLANTIYIGTEDSCLYCVDSTGHVAWRYRTGGLIKSSPAVADNGDVLFGSYDGYLYAIDRDGSFKWRYPTEGEILSSPALDDSGVIYFGSCDSNLYALNSNGSFRWKYKMGGQLWSSPAIGKNRTVYVGCNDCYLYAINPDGSYKWRRQVGARSITSSPALDGEENIYVGSTGAMYLFKIDSLGSEKWRFRLPGYVESSPAIARNRTLYVQSHYPSYLVAIGNAGAISDRVQANITGPIVQAHPNPFVTGTAVSITVGDDKFVELRIFDERGCLVKQVEMSPQEGAVKLTVTWSGENQNGSVVPPGVYFLHLKTKKAMSCGKIVKLTPHDLSLRNNTR